jgi:TPR repeat protein
MQNWLRAAVMVVALGCAGPVMADVWEDIAAADARGDHATLIRLWRPLAEQGDAGAQTGLGALYYTGQGVPKDDAQAVKWFRLAAEQGYADAQTVLGVIYYYGQGVPKDYVLSYMWANLAAAGGEEMGREYRDLGAAKMTPAQIAEAQKLSREWKPKPAK